MVLRFPTISLECTDGIAGYFPEVQNSLFLNDQESFE